MRIQETIPGVAVAVLAASGTAIAQQVTPMESTISEARFVRPVKVAPIHGINPDGTYIIGEWRPYEDAHFPLSGDFPPPRILDSFEGADGVCGEAGTLFPANGPLSGGIEPACDFGMGNTGACGDGDTTRWFRGTTYVSNSYIQPIGSLANGAADVADFLAFAWYNNVGADNSPDACGNFIDETIVGILVFNSSVGSQVNGTDVVTRQMLEDNFKDGILLNFGAINSGGYYFTNVPLGPDSGGERGEEIGIVVDDQGNESCVPIQAGDAVQMDFIAFDTFEETLIYDTAYGQPMIWGPKDTALQGSWASHAFLYADGAFDFGKGLPEDCATYDASTPTSEGGDGVIDPEVDTRYRARGSCPRFQGIMIGLYGDEECAGGDVLCVTDFTILRGIQTGGGVGDTCVSDDTRWTFQPDAIAATVVAPISVELRATTGNLNPSTYTFEVETRSQTNGQRGVVLRVEVFNFDSGQYEGSVFPNIPDTDTVFTVVKDTNAGAYVNNSGQVRVRVSYLRPAGVPPFWTIGIDQATWTIE